MVYRHISVKKGPVSTVSLNRPEVRNAMDDSTLKEIAHAFKSFSKDSKLRAVVVRGEGKSFCAGADIGWMKRAGKLPPAAARRDAGLLVDMCRSVDACPVPVIARTHGAVFGGGLGLISACDIVVAGQSSKMCFSEPRLGIIPAVISCFVVPKIGEAQARRYYLTAEVFGAETAKRLGIVHEVVPDSELDAKVSELTGEILKSGPQAVRQAKLLLRKFPGLAFPARVNLVINTLIKLRGSAEGQEGLSAFLEKRPPSWISETAGKP